MKNPHDRDAPESHDASSLEPPPAYGPTAEGQIPTAPTLASEGTHLDAPAYEQTDHVIPTNDEGRIDLHIGEGLSDLCRHFTNGMTMEKAQEREQIPLPTALLLPPAMNILMLVVGSRGDVQPFIALGQALKDDGHRVRLATHPHFRSFVEAHGIEFFSIGGDPAELMAYMVQNPGLVPKFAALRRGEIQKRRRSMRDMVHASWRACFEPGTFPREKSLKNSMEKVVKSHAKQKDPTPFVADLIVANPPSLAHIHCAERLGIPLHILFT
jgi:hypothetical protein